MTALSVQGLHWGTQPLVGEREQTIMNNTLETSQEVWPHHKTCTRHTQRANQPQQGGRDAHDVRLWGKARKSNQINVAGEKELRNMQLSEAACISGRQKAHGVARGRQTNCFVWWLTSVCAHTLWWVWREVHSAARCVPEDRYTVLNNPVSVGHELGGVGKPLTRAIEWRCFGALKRFTNKVYNSFLCERSFHFKQFLEKKSRRRKG